MKHNPQSSKPLVAFVLTLSFCLACCLLLSWMMPPQKRPFDYLAQGVFSALCALPTGAAWRSLRQQQKRAFAE